MRGVLWLTHLLNVLFGQHRLHKLGHVQRCVVICHATYSHFFPLRRSASHRFTVRFCAARWRRTATSELTAENFWPSLVFPRLQSGNFHYLYRCKFWHELSLYRFLCSSWWTKQDHWGCEPVPQQDDHQTGETQFTAQRWLRPHNGRKFWLLVLRWTYRTRGE